MRLVTGVVIGKTRLAAVAQAVDVEIAFRKSTQWYPSSSFAHPVLVMRSYTAGIRSVLKGQR
jgi:hypothetical protein